MMDAAKIDALGEKFGAAIAAADIAALDDLFAPQLHRVDASGAGGFAITNMPACINFTLHGDRIARIEEFLDSAQTSGFDATQMTLGPAPGD